jgi:pseudouridine synthase
MTENERPKIRLAKLLAQRGIAARRKAEDLIASGQVTVNGEKVPVVTLVDPERDRIVVRGKPLPAEQQRRCYVLNKPAGYVTGRKDYRGRPSVLDLCKGLPVRVEPIGRLDYETTGVLLLTNDGQLAHRLTHPSRGIPKRYVASVIGVPDEAAMRAIRQGVELDDGRTAPAQARVLKRGPGGNSQVEVTVTEGRNRLVRRMLLKVGHPVLALERREFAGIGLSGLKVGQVRELTPPELGRLRELAGLSERD